MKIQPSVVLQLRQQSPPTVSMHHEKLKTDKILMWVANETSHNGQKNWMNTTELLYLFWCSIWAIRTPVKYQENELPCCEQCKSCQ